MVNIKLIIFSCLFIFLARIIISEDPIKTV